VSVPVSIEVRDLAKSFRIPAPNQSLLRRARAGNPFRAAPGRELAVLKDVSFDIHQGEFFGVVGRNGSGKSTLLKMIAGIYGADHGTIRVAGRLAPFLELGVGFSPEQAAHENVVMNGVMMGLTPRQARQRCDEIIDFAGLRGYTDLKLNNYSSGMKVRLGFAVMTHVDADVLLVDEVLAVGDTEFREKCEDVFERMHAEGRTIVLVTHSMDAINAHCQRALILHDGRMDSVDEPGRIATRYAEVNIGDAVARRPERVPEAAKRLVGVLSDPALEVVEAAVVAADGTPVERLEPRQPIELRARVSCSRDLDSPCFTFRIVDSREKLLFEREGEPLADRARAGESFEVSVRIANHLAAGRYLLGCRIDALEADGILQPASPMKVARFAVEGSRGSGVVALGCDFSAEVVEPEGARS
jgi:ABC-type polysaccharide/polyol phosphate transport system ATPase subunit